MTARRTDAAIHQLRIESKLGLADVEAALQTAAHAAGQRGLSTASVELARVDLLPDRTVVYFRGDESVADGLKETLAKKAPEAKLSVQTVAPEALAKAP